MNWGIFFEDQGGRALARERLFSGASSKKHITHPGPGCSAIAGSSCGLRERLLPRYCDGALGTVGRTRAWNSPPCSGRRLRCGWLKQNP